MSLERPAGDLVVSLPGKGKAMGGEEREDIQKHPGRLLPHPCCAVLQVRTNVALGPFPNSLKFIFMDIMMKYYMNLYE